MVSAALFAPPPCSTIGSTIAVVVEFTYVVVPPTTKLPVNVKLLAFTLPVVFKLPTLALPVTFNVLVTLPVNDRLPAVILPVYVGKYAATFVFE